jgi:hypothetical protein
LMPWMVVTLIVRLVDVAGRLPANNFDCLHRWDRNHHHETMKL